MTKNLGFNIMELVEQSVPDNQEDQKVPSPDHFGDQPKSPVVNKLKNTEITLEQKSVISEPDEKPVTKKTTESKMTRPAGKVEPTSRVSSVLSNLTTGREMVEREVILSVIDRVFTETPVSEEDKMISFRGNRTIDNFYTQLPGALKPHLKNKRIAKEKIMGLVLQLITSDETYRREILGGVILHLLEKDN